MQSIRLRLLLILLVCSGIIFLLVAVSHLFLEGENGSPSRRTAVEAILKADKRIADIPFDFDAIEGHRLATVG